MGPRYVFFFFSTFFFIYLLYYAHLPAPSYVFRPPVTLFDHPAISFHPQPHVPTSQLAILTCFNTHQPFQAPQVPKHAYEQLYTCFLFVFFFFSSLPLECVYESSYTCFLFFFLFLFFSPPQNTCMSNHTRVSELFSFFFSSPPLGMHVQVIIHMFPGFIFCLRPPWTCIGVFCEFVFFFFFSLPLGQV
jgi:hypothetical protein